jgi:hypothetical protein
MRTALTLAAAVVINVTALAALGWDVSRAQRAPSGEVSITQIEEPTQVAAVAPAKVDGQVVQTANSL